MYIDIYPRVQNDHCDFLLRTINDEKMYTHIHTRIRAGELKKKPQINQIKTRQ